MSLPHDHLLNDEEVVRVQKLHPDAKLPTRANSNDAGYDLYSVECITIMPKARSVIKTGIALEMPEYFAGLVWPRSGLSVKHGIDVLAGVIDSGYRGEIMVCLYNTSDVEVGINIGDRIAQIIFQEVPRTVLALANDQLGASQRGSNGFGSSGA